ncbi:MAG: ribonuclease HII [Blautia sp.]|nr:ribonuclease HII [Blautia sp.]
MKTIAQIRREFETAGWAHAQTLCLAYADDPRSGVQAMIKKAAHAAQSLENELARLQAMREYEEKYAHVGLICGIDEVGRGPLAGPVFACAVILPPDCRILYLNDSKQLSAAKREELDQEIRETAIAVGLGSVSQERIDEINILQATYEAMRQAVRELTPGPSLLLVDAVTIPDMEIPQVPLIKGDTRSVSIAAASIVAKVARDRLMEEYDHEYPQYGFASNKGYGSAAHIKALKEYGPCPLHRRSFISGIVN